MNLLTVSSLVYLTCSALIAQDAFNHSPMDPGIKALQEMGAEYRRAVVWVKLKNFQGDEFKMLQTLGHHLRFLEMDGVPVADEGLRDIRILGNLTELGLAYTPITDDALRHLAPLKHLRSLRLSATNVTGAGLSHLADCRLTRLYLSKSKFNQDGQKHLGLFPTLSDLYLDDTRFDNKGMVHLKPLTSLSDLSLTGTQLEADGGLAEIDGRMPGLSVLALSRTRVDDRCIRHLASFPRLVEFCVDRTQVTAAGMRQVAQLRLQGFFQYLISLKVSPKQLPPEVHAELIGAIENLHVEFVDEPEPAKPVK